MKRTHIRFCTCASGVIVSRTLPQETMLTCLKLGELCSVYKEVAEGGRFVNRCPKALWTNNELGHTMSPFVSESAHLDRRLLRLDQGGRLFSGPKRPPTRRRGSPPVLWCQLWWI